MRRLIRIVALGAALVVSGSAFAQQYPSKPVKVIVPILVRRPLCEHATDWR